MKIVKRILLIAGIIIVLLLVAGVFTKKDYSVTREITINKSRSEVFHYIKYLKNQNNYSKWANMDPKMKKEFRGIDGAPGFVSAWSSEQGDVGKGEQEIKAIEEGKRIDYEIRFIEPFASVAPAFMSTDSISASQTTVKWGFNGHMKYPANLMLLFMDMDKMIGNDLQTGLTNLKGILEKQ